MKISLNLRSKRVWLGAFFMLVSFAVCYAASGSLLKSAALAVCFAAVSVVRVDVSEKYQVVVVLTAAAITAFLSLFLTQFSLSENLEGILEGRIFWGLLCCVVVYCLVFSLVPNVRTASAISIGLLMILTTANYFVLTYRGSELMPMDILSFETALNVAGGYDYTFGPNLIYGWTMCGLYIFSLFSIRVPLLTHRGAFRAASLSMGVCIAAVFAFGTTEIPTSHFRNSGAAQNGYILNFALSIREIFISSPEGYSQEAVEKIMEPYLQDDSNVSKEESPDIIVIMIESYSDLSVLGNNLNTSDDPTPFLSSLHENTVRGYALTSSFGARTANSEYEFLTGGTMAFAPEGAIAFQQYVSENSYSMVSTLENLGYTSLAMHPYYADGWMRDTVWPTLGFDTCLFVDNFPPGGDTLRNYVSDMEMVDQVIAQYEQRDASKPFFLFGVTMQNHSPFTYEGDNFEVTVTLEGYSTDYPQGDQYLSLLRETDKAMETLISHFAEVERDTIVVFFGDHLPSLDDGLYEDIHGGSFSTLDEQILQYKIPFFIWANYDIAEQTVDCTSLSYLSTLVYETAGIELPAYHRFLKDLQGAVPSMNAYGYYSREQEKYLAIDEASEEEAEWLNKYHMLQYQYMFEYPDPVFYGAGD